ncbi:O-antigen ligase [Geobacillus sp. WSUCF-018B]|uniref:O-antigen ligase family protein n=1 Tax=Geobacillus sp. WSUCF-018B TaxID=2055939 RepID=UPI0011AF2BCE|nr:O-antigen ligase family protein [Geobacillus sp. WSUCF-018B]
MKIRYINDLFALGLVIVLILSFYTTILISPIVLLVILILSFPLTFTISKLGYNRIFIFTFLLYLYVILSALISGIPFKELSNYYFIRYDGNFLYSYSPLLLIPLIQRHNLNTGLILKIFCISTSLILLFSHLVNISFFDAHNAYGGFLGLVIGVNIILIKDKIMWVPLIINTYLLIISDSRGSIFAIILAFILIFLKKKGFNVLYKLIITCIFLFMIIVFIEGYIVWLKMNKPIALTLDQIFQYYIPYGYLGSIIREIFDRSYTIIHRIYFYWPLAIDNFLNSPLIGIGFSRYDDVPYNLGGIKNLIYLNKGYIISHTNYHAHNSYLHILSELGILGAGLFFMIFKGILDNAKRLEIKEQLLVQTLTIYMLIVSLSEHRITTPSQMIPYFIIVILILCRNRGDISK